MTKDEAVSAIAGALMVLEDDDVEIVASVLYQAIDRANVHKNIARKTGGSGWRQGVIDELHKIDFPL